MLIIKRIYLSAVLQEQIHEVSPIFLRRKDQRRQIINIFAIQIDLMLAEHRLKLVLCIILFQG